MTFDALFQQIDRLPDDNRIYVAGCCGEPTALIDAMAARWVGPRTFTGVYIPGVNRCDLTDLGPGCRVESFFMTPALRRSFAAGRVGFLPLHYTDIYRHLAGPANCGLALFQVTPPAEDGTVGLGVAVDFTPALVDAGIPLVGQVNPCLPDVPDGHRLPVARFATLIEAETTLPTYDPGSLSPEMMEIGRRIADLIRPGDTVQLGLGKLQASVLAALGDHRNLAFHAGMITDALLPALDNGVFGRGVTTGVALGSPALYDRMATEAGIRFRPVSHTHAAATLASIDRLVTVNSVVEIDLLGQANAEMLDGRQISGHGGLVDFLRGGRTARQGRSILAVPATAGEGARSRIVNHLAPDTVVTAARADTDLVVTEYGVAGLRAADIDARAEALIAIAAPAFRDQLSRDWDQRRRSM